ncbi:MAG TPA: hypothetical protein PKD85_14460, partial [Saprospiraceae bacterium]|nr:hypothetical protein [Saprospiraceae bacterium]
MQGIFLIICFLIVAFVIYKCKEDKKKHESFIEGLGGGRGGGGRGGGGRGGGGRGGGGRGGG